MFSSPSPSESPSESPSDPAGEGSPEPLDQLDGSPSDSGEPSDESDDGTHGRTSSRSADGAGGKVSALGKQATKLAIKQGILTGTDVLHRVAAKTEEARAVGLYRADEDDAEGIADPLAAIAGRRQGSLGAMANPDVADAVRAMVAVAGYAAKQVALQIQLNDYRLEQQRGETVPGTVA
jgi:hypothetical protein